MVFFRDCLCLSTNPIMVPCPIILVPWLSGLSATSVCPDVYTIGFSKTICIELLRAVPIP